MYAASELERLRLRRGDVLVVEGNGGVDQIGRNAIFRGEIDDCVHQNHLIRVRADLARMAPDLLSLFLNSDPGRAQMVDKARTTSGLYTLSVSKVGQLDLPVPPLDVQRQVADEVYNRLEWTADLRSASATQFASMEVLAAALLRQAFAGDLSA